MLYKKFLLLFLLPFLSMLSCSENNIAPVNTPDPTIAELYFNNSSLDTMVCSYYPLDQTNNRTGEKFNSYYFKSGNVILSEKDAFVLYGTSPIDSTVSNDYFALGEDKIFLHANSIKDLIKRIDKKYKIETPVPIEDKWFVIADFDTNSQSSWIAFDYKFNEVIQNDIFTGTATMTVEKMDSVNTYINGKNTTIMGFAVKYKVDATWEANGKYYPIYFIININYHFAKNIGLINITQESAIVDLGQKYFDYLGVEKVLN